MAGGKETPRQKMIGMMYLVLTALLALNVSKSILDAFVAIEENMQQANLTELARGDEKRGGLDLVIAEKKTSPGPAAKAEKLLEIVDKIDKLAAAEIKKIDDLKFEILEACGEDMTSIGKEESIVTIAYDAKKRPLKPTRMNLAFVSSKDKYDDPMRIMIGVETDIKKPVGKGMDLFNDMKEYRDALVEAVAGSQVATSETTGKVEFVKKNKFKSTDITKYKDQTELGILVRKEIDKQGTVNEDDIDAIIEIYRGLTKIEYSTVHEEEGVHWIGKTFDHSPSVAAIASLTSLQKDILAARAKAVSRIRARVGGGEYSFNKVIPLAYGPEVVNQNEEFTVEVLMAAFDTDKQPEVELEGNPIDKKDIRDGKGMIKMKIGASKTLRGRVAIAKKNGDLTWREWEKEITVMKPSGSIELPEMNMLYRGYANKVNATASGYPTTGLSASGASASKSGEGWIVSPGNGKSATLSVSGTTADGKTVTLKTMKFRVSNLPSPELYWGNVPSGGKASRAQTKLFAKYPPEIPLNAKFRIISWECQVPGAQGRPPAGPGANISAASTLLRAARTGTQVSFICKVVGPDGIQRTKAGAFKI
jgi:gliding motility-associated protein GldM